ncbi:zona pellucida sperm-binding protein 3-like [Scomber scombrus]|uniref:Zona pellucida sperm-binding protein 3 n=1 Tax=Scomber scombrus TaxID=13677 RepID=A0AAV1PBL0_SCOSC|nr:zona pellucida sperm-binding protein 3-like [Scomber scombrus]
MVMKWTAVCLVALALFGSFCDAQWNKKKQNQEAMVPQQTKQTFNEPLKWEYPLLAEPEPGPTVPFELRHPVPAKTVAVECREKDAHVEVKKDFFGIGQLINPADLHLGTCGPVAEDTGAQVLIYVSELHDCGSSLRMDEHFLIYTFQLNYDPQSLGPSPVVRTTKAAVIVECHYPRKHNVSSLPLDPLWIPFSAVKFAEEFLYFTLKLMTVDFQHERPSYQYYLGDLVHMEATVKLYHHVPLRVYVESCVATLSPEMNSNPKYGFIESGCLLDARITGSDSKFMPRTADNKLQFQLEAFRFKNADSGMLYITCHLRATSAAHAIDSGHRACSYINGWKEAGGTDAACGSCESGQVDTPGKSGTGQTGTSTGYWGGGSDRKIRDVSQSETIEWEGDVTLGPIPIEEKVVS